MVASDINGGLGLFDLLAEPFDFGFVVQCKADEPFVVSDRFGQSRKQEWRPRGVQLAVQQAVERNALVVQVVTIGKELVCPAGAFVFDLEGFDEGGLSRTVLGLHGSRYGFEPVEVLLTELNDFVREG